MRLGGGTLGCPIREIVKGLHDWSSVDEEFMAVFVGRHFLWDGRPILIRCAATALAGV